MGVKIGKSLITLFVLAMMLSAMPIIMPVTKADESPPPAPSFWVAPQTETFTTSNGSLGTLFNVTVMAEAVNGTDSWSVQLGFNASQLQAIAAGFTAVSTSQLFAGHATTPLGPLIDNNGSTTDTPGEGSVEISETLLGNDFIAATNASVCWVTFNVTAAPATGQTLASLIDPAFGLPSGTGETLFILQSPTTVYPYAEIDNPNTAPCTYSFSAASVTPPPVHDVVVSSVSAASSVTQGALLPVSVVVLNNGTVTESSVVVNATANGTLIGVQTVASLAAGNSSTLTFTWNTTGVSVGNYTVTGTVTPVANQTDLTGLSKSVTVQVLAVPTVQYYLTVTSLYGSPSPVSGWFGNGTSINESVTSPASGATGVQYVCTGWTGTGSVPSSGTSSSVTFVISANSTITWNWKTQYYLNVSSAYDSPSPASGWFDSGSNVTESVTSPVAGPAGTSYVCTGWSGSGSVPASGTASSVTFTITAPSSITWNWKTVTQVTHDVVVSSVSAASSVTQGALLPVSVVVLNNGTVAESSVVVNATANGTLIGVQTVASLAAGGNQTLTFTWNTTGVSVGNYTVTGTVTPVANQTDLTGLSKSVTVQVLAVSVVQYYLTVISLYDSPTPLSGWFGNGTSINESVTSPVSGATGVQYVCTGWTGTGSVPSSGTSSSVTFVISTNSTITWNWKTQYYLTVTSLHDSPSPVSGWFDSGTSINESVSSPVSGGSGTQYVCTGWSGTGSVPASGTASSVVFTISAPSSIVWSWETQYYLTVSSPYGSPTPSSGWFNSGTSITESVTSPVSGGSGVQYVCTGWSGTGSVPTSGTASSITFTITAPSSITWTWQTQYYLTVSSPYGSPSPLSGWFNSGTSINESVTSPVAGASGVQYVCTGWSGTGSVPASGTASSVVFTISAPSSIVWGWETQYYLTVSSAYGSPSPSSGWFNSGTSINESVTSPTAGPTGTQYVCTGWSGTGSVPPSGTASSVVFTITAPSSIVWTWETQYYLTVTSLHDSPSPVSGWFDSGTSITESVTSPTPGSSGTQYVCTGWSGYGSVPGSGTASSVSFTIVQPSGITWNWKTQYSVRALWLFLVFSMALGVIGAFVLILLLFPMSRRPRRKKILRGSNTVVVVHPHV